METGHDLELISDDSYTGSKEGMTARVGAEISAFREEILGLSVHELAGRLGVPSSSVWRWENAKAMPNLYNMFKLYNLGLEYGEVPNLLPFLGEDIWFFLNLRKIKNPLYVTAKVPDDKKTIWKLLSAIAGNGDESFQGSDLRRIIVKPEGQELQVQMIINVSGAEPGDDESVATRRAMGKVVKAIDPKARCLLIRKLLRTLGLDRKIAELERQKKELSATG